MGLLTGILIATAIKSAVSISENVAEAAAARSNERAAEANARAAEARAAANNSVQYRPQYVQQTSPQIRNNQYEIDLVYAKIAMITYIAKADNVITAEERSELDQLVYVAGNMYGYDFAVRARGIIENEGSSFISVEPYLRKIQDKDLDSFLFYAEEIARTDNRMTAEETAALNKIRSYIDSRKGKKEFSNLICPSCGGHMHSDEYGFRAVCTCCGRETILNTDNSPHRVNAPTTCASCGRTLAKFDNSKRFSFCPYCGGNVYSNTGPAYAAQRPAARATINNTRPVNNGPNLFISFNTVNPSVGMVTRIVSTGVKNTYVNGQTLSFHLPQGSQEIILKIGMKNYSRTVVIPPSNSPVRIYASFNGRAQISIDQPPC